MSNSSICPGERGRGVGSITFKRADQGFGIKCRLSWARPAIGGHCAFGETVHKVADNEVFAGEVFQGEAGGFCKEALGTDTGAVHS